MLLTYDGSSSDEVATQIDQARQICQTSLIGLTSLNDKTQATAIWSVRGALVKAFSEKDYIKKRSYTIYGRFSCNIILYIVFLRRFFTLDIVPYRLNALKDA